MSENNPLDNPLAAAVLPTTAQESVDEATILFGAPGSNITAPTGFTFDALGADMIARYDALQARLDLDNPDEKLLAEIEQTWAMFSHGASLSDVTPALYRELAAAPASMGNWLTPLHAAVHQTRFTPGAADLDAPLFSIPETKIMRLPIEQAQYLRREMGPETNQVSIDAFDRVIETGFDLAAGWLADADRGIDTAPESWFIKSGTFSNKFEFRNTRCRESDEMGQYFHLLANQAMTLGANQTVDLVVRRWIDAPADTPAIYHGMPLRTEVRAFVDLGAPGDDAGPSTEPELLGITPYWHPQVMRSALALALNHPGMGARQQDYHTWDAHQGQLAAGMTRHRAPIEERLRALLPMLQTHFHNHGLTGAWSIDVMVDEHPGTAAPDDTQPDYWLIDLAPMHSSALTDVLAGTEEYTYVPLERIRELTRRPRSLLNDQVSDVFAMHRRRVLHFPEIHADLPARPAPTFDAELNRR